MRIVFRSRARPLLILPELQAFTYSKPESLAVSLQDHVLAPNIEEVPLAVRIWAREGLNGNRCANRSLAPEIFQQ